MPDPTDLSMHRYRQRGWAAKALSGEGSLVTRRTINVCILVAAICLLFGSVAVLHRQLSAIGQDVVDQAAEFDFSRYGITQFRQGHDDGAKSVRKSPGESRTARKRRRKREKEQMATFEEILSDGNDEVVRSADEDETDRAVRPDDGRNGKDEELDEFLSLGGDIGEWVREERPDKRLRESEGGGEADHKSRELMTHGGRLRGGEIPPFRQRNSDLRRVDRAGPKETLRQAERSGVWDRSRGSLGVEFSSDDEPVDDETRSRLENMRDIEDALMLGDGRSTAKKNSWGRVQDGKSAKTGVKLSPDPLNPENNPLLQDPDSAEPAGLTKTDKEFLKAFRSKFRQDVRHRTDPNESDSTGGRWVLEDQRKSGHKGMRTETADLDSAAREQSIKLESLSRLSKESLNSDANGDSMGSSTGATLDPNLRLPTRIQLADPNGSRTKKSNVHKLSDGGEMRWGNFPGLHPRLTFSGFMEEFLFDDSCSMRVFMAWMSPDWALTVRHQRVLESLLYFNPKACVVVFSESVGLDFFQSFSDDGYRVTVVMPNLAELLEDTAADVFATIWMMWRQVELFYVHYPELLRIAALYKYGGIYLEWDMIVLRPLTGLNNNVIGSEILEDGQQRPIGAFMAFEKLSPFLNRSLEEFTATYDETSRHRNGQALLQRVMDSWDVGHDTKLSAADLPRLEPPFLFCPLPSRSIYRYFNAPDSEADFAQELQLLDKILSHSFTVHIWNELTHTLVPKPGSLVSKLMERNCIRCTDFL